MSHPSSFETTQPQVIDQQTLLGPLPDRPELGDRALIRTYDITLPKSILHDALDELEAAYGEPDTYNLQNVAYKPDAEDITGGVITTFSPNMLDDPRGSFPSTMRLADELFTGLFDVTDADLNLIRYASERPEDPTVFIGQLHVDTTHYGYNERLRRKGGVDLTSRDLWRQVVNMGPHSRHFQLFKEPLQYFEENGVDVNHIRRYHQSVPGAEIADVDPNILEPDEMGGEDSSIIVRIPPYEPGKLSVLEFWSTQVPHANVDAAEGHFSAAAGTIYERM